MGIRIRLIKIREINYNERTCSGEYLDTGGIVLNVFILTPMEELSLPRVFNDSGDENLGDGQLGVVIFDEFERPFLIGFVEINHNLKTQKFLRPKIKPGEIYKQGPRGQFLSMDLSGNWAIHGGPLDGINYDSANRTLNYKSNIHSFIGMGFELILGVVRRLGKFILKGTELMYEFTLKLVRPITNLSIAQFSLGDILDENGIPIQGKVLPLIFLIKLFNDAGILVSEINIDKGGNVIFKFSDMEVNFNNKIKVSGQSPLSSIILNIAKFLVGSDNANERVILGDTFYHNVFLTHTHSTPVGPTSPPQIVYPDKSVLSDIMSIKSNF